MIRKPSFAPPGRGNPLRVIVGRLLWLRPPICLQLPEWLWQPVSLRMPRALRAPVPPRLAHALHLRISTRFSLMLALSLLLPLALALLAGLLMSAGCSISKPELPKFTTTVTVPLGARRLSVADLLEDHSFLTVGADSTLAFAGAGDPDTLDVFPDLGLDLAGAPAVLPGTNGQRVPVSASDWLTVTGGISVDYEVKD